MPNLFLELDIDAQLFLFDSEKMIAELGDNFEMEDEKPDGPISIDDMDFSYEGFNVVEIDYGFFVCSDNFLKNSVLELNEVSPFSIRVKGIAKINANQDLYEYLIEDEKPNIFLYQVTTVAEGGKEYDASSGKSPLEWIELYPTKSYEFFPNADGGNLKISCDISKKKPK